MRWMLVGGVIFWGGINLVWAEIFEKNIQSDFQGLLRENIVQIVTQGQLWGIPAATFDDPFFIGWGLEVTLVDEGASKGEVYMISFYSSPRPYPHEKVTSYRVWDKGTKILNSGRIFNFQVLNHDWAPRNQWQVLSLRSGEYPLLFVLEPTFQSTYKEGVASQKFLVKLKPIYNAQGILNFEIFDKVTKKRVNSAQIIMDGKSLSWPNKTTFFQSKGIYPVEVKADGYENRRLQVQIEPGRENLIQVALVHSQTQLIFNVAEAVEILLDGKALVGKERTHGITVASGSHTVTLILGSYTISRNLLAEEGKKYQINFILSLDFKEIPSP